MKKEYKRIKTIVEGISKDIQFKGMKHVYDGMITIPETGIEIRQYTLVNKSTGKNIMTLIKS
jgi:ABC-type antimicrobial peptide transport system permease subunit